MLHTSILLVALLFSDIIENFDLLIDLVVQCKDILRLDICGLVSLEQREVIPNLQYSIEDRLFLWIEGQAVSGGVGHGGESDCSQTPDVVTNVLRCRSAAPQKVLSEGGRLWRYVTVIRHARAFFGSGGSGEPHDFRVR